MTHHTTTNTHAGAKPGIVGSIVNAVSGNKSHTTHGTHGTHGTHANTHVAGTGVGHGTHTGHGHGHSTHTAHNVEHHANGAVTHSTTTGIPHVSLGQKISGKIDVMVGNATHNPAKVATGHLKETGGIPRTAPY